MRIHIYIIPSPNNKPPQPPNSQYSQYIIVYHIWGVFIIRGVGRFIIRGRGLYSPGTECIRC